MPQKKFIKKDDKKYVDVLTEDEPIPGQKFACLSFISPEEILKDKKIYYFEEFVKQWDFNKSMSKYNTFLNFLCYKFHLKLDDVMVDFNEFIKEEKDNLLKENVLDDYKTFIDKNEERLQSEFDVKNEFQTNIRGIKIKGVFPTIEEAQYRCKLLREIDPYHDIHIGQVGLWLPFDPEAYKTGNVEYMEDELNQLMHEKIKNEKNAKTEFEMRVKATKEQAIKENKEKAEISKTKLTQTIDSEGNLVGINNASTVESFISKSELVSEKEIYKQLFEGDDIVVDKNADHGTEVLKKLLNTK